MGTVPAPNPVALAAAGVRGELCQGASRHGRESGNGLGSPPRDCFSQPVFVNITLTSILRRVLPLKGFCYRWARWEAFSQAVIEIGIEARKGARARCRCCRKPAPVYDTRHQARRWRFISVWAIAVFLVYRPRRLECPRCGVQSNTCLGPAANCSFATHCAFSWPVGAPAFLAGCGFVF